MAVATIGKMTSVAIVATDCTNKTRVAGQGRGSQRLWKKHVFRQLPFIRFKNVHYTSPTWPTKSSSGSNTGAIRHFHVGGDDQALTVRLELLHQIGQFIVQVVASPDSGTPVTIFNIRIIALLGVDANYLLHRSEDNGSLQTPWTAIESAGKLVLHNDIGRYSLNYSHHKPGTG